METGFPPVFWAPLYPMAWQQGLLDNLLRKFGNGLAPGRTKRFELLGPVREDQTQVFLLVQVTSLCSDCCPFKPLGVVYGDFWWLWPAYFHPCSYSRIQNYLTPPPPKQQLQALPISNPLRFFFTSYLISNLAIQHSILFCTCLYNHFLKMCVFFLAHLAACGILVP